jgi:hypothetical protein
VPTKLARHTVSETPDVARALDAAAAVWPGETRSRLLRRLILTGGQVIQHEPDYRRRMVAKWSGFLADAYPPGAAAALKDEWPE